jgi:glutamate/aspartate transport system substrate-binding protein
MLQRAGGCALGALRRACLGMALSAGVLAAAPALAAEDALLQMHRSGRISLGVRDQAPPTSSLDASGVHVGYHVDICNRIVQAIRQRFDMPALKITTVTTTLATRFAMLNNGTIDIDCGHNAVTSAGMQQALFAHATLVTDLRAMTVVENQSLRLGSLDGRTIGTVVGGSELPLIRSLARKSQMKVTEALGRTSQEAFALLEAGRVDLIALAEPYLLAQRARSGNPARYVLLDGVLRTEPVALIVRLSDEKLLAVANEVIDAMMRTGEMERLYRKWFVEPLPGQKEGLDLPMSPKLRALFANPGSEMMDF